ncbi:MAG: hypothetical protein KAS07_02515 [Candidatus Pacebacteria bacterium]|nr:hypothetical protein [Candidatus Paceibacterota bacterium]
MSKGILYIFGIVFSVAVIAIGLLGFDFYKDLWDGVMYLFNHPKEFVRIVISTVGLMLLAVSAVKLGRWLEKRRLEKE